jgi:hypothetical protein
MRTSLEFGVLGTTIVIGYAADLVQSHQWETQQFLCEAAAMDSKYKANIAIRTADLRNFEEKPIALGPEHSLGYRSTPAEYFASGGSR